MEDILKNIEGSIPAESKLKLKKTFSLSNPNFLSFSENLRRLVLSNDFIKENLFKGKIGAIYYSGELLSETFYDFWHKNSENIEEIFLNKIENYSYVYGFEWEHRIKNS
jgi:hypothetical protein